MITMKQSLTSTGMRVSVLFLIVAVLLLLIDEQCEAALNSHSETMYQRTEIVCHDKLLDWRNSSTTTTTAAGDVGAPADSSRMRWQGVRVRGKWKPSSPSSAVRPSFLTSDQGKFDLSFRQFMLEGNTVQNISGQLYFFTDRKKGPAGGSLEVSGVYNPDSGEVCFVGCVRESFQRLPKLIWTLNGTLIANSTNSSFFRPTFVDSDEACIVHGELTVSQSSKASKRTVTGSLGSLITNSSASGFFTDVKLDGRMVENKNQMNLYRRDIFVRSAIFAVEAVIIMWQIFHSIRSPDSYFISMLMIIVQIVAIVAFAWDSIFLYIHMVTSAVTRGQFKYLFSSLSLIPWLVLTIVVLLNVLFLLVVLRKRFVAKRLNVVERPTEVVLGIICLVIYAFTALIIWFTHNFDTYVQVVWCWFLLPQVVANIFWDLRLKPLHWVYVVGVSLSRVTFIGFQAVRPTILGYDDLNDFPHGWFWGIFFTVLFFGSYALLQQYYGGRCFLPQRWFGYKQIPSSKGENNQAQSYAKDEDTMLDL